MNSSSQVLTNSRKKPCLVLAHDNTDAHNNTDDIITNLHESVLTDILTRLPTKDAFRTSILSKAWECKWTSSFNVHIDYNWWYHPSTRSFSDESFVNFVGTAIISPQHPLRSFSLKCQSYKDSGCLQTWISAVLRRGVERFELFIHKQGSIFPPSLMNTTSLRTFKLWQPEGILNVLTKNFLPNLTSLDICGVRIVNGNANERTVTFTFPVLETLTLLDCVWENVESVEIYAPSLTTVISNTSPVEWKYGYSVMIVAPRLTTFVCNFGLLEKIILDGSSIVSAEIICDDDGTNKIHLLEDIGFRVRNLLNTCTSLEELELSGFTGSEVLQYGPPLRCLDKLKRLSLPIVQNNYKQLFELLHAAPSLKYLSILLCGWDDSYHGAMESIPSCIVSQLEEVVIHGFRHLLPECTTAKYDVIKFFLKNAEQLKKFIVDDYAPRHKPEELREILSTFPKCSPYLTIEVVRRPRKSFIPKGW